MPVNSSGHVADPTTRTIETVHREIATLDDKMKHSLCAARELVDERFKGVDQMRSLIEAQRIEQKKDTKDAVDAALAAAKEAVKEQTSASGLSIGKSEAATAKQLEQLTITFTAAIAGVTGNLADLKERVVTMESMKQGGKDNTALIFSIVTLIAVVLSIALTVSHLTS